MNDRLDRKGQDGNVGKDIQGRGYDRCIAHAMPRNCRVPHFFDWHASQEIQEQESQALAGSEDSQDLLPVNIDPLIGGVAAREYRVIK